MSDNRDVLREELSKTIDTYVKYVSVETGATDQKINDEVESLMRKLDDFEQLLMLSQSDGNVCLFKHVPGLENKFAELKLVFDRVDSLERMVSRIRDDMDKLDRQLREAEATIEPAGTSAGNLKSLVPFIFNPRSLIVDGAAPMPSTEFQPIALFSTESFFSTEESQSVQN